MGAAVSYRAGDVLAAARRRLALVFDHFGRVVVSVSGGKDSTVLYHLSIDEAARRGRTVELFFLDQEAEYRSSVEQVERMMAHPLAVPRWFQVPLRMTNATSFREEFLHAWGDGAAWMRPKHPLATHGVAGACPDRFHDFFGWWEAQAGQPTAFLVGLRSKESLDRFRAVTSAAGWRGVPWSTRGAGENAWRFYPLYDWTFGDVWKYIADGGVPYNRVYDWMYARYGANARTMRVSNLIHERSFRALADLQEFEPDTYEALLRRLGGVHCAALYAADQHVYEARTLPAAHPSWRVYRDYLLATTPGVRVARFRARFARQGADEETCRQQVRQLLLNDWENNVAVRHGMSDRVRATWEARL